MSKEHIIYSVSNIFNEKLYIGQTTCGIKSRWKQHINAASKGHRGKFYSAMRKYGIGNFTIKEIAKVNNKEELNELEIFLIKILDSAKNGYNTHSGGENSIINSMKECDDYDSFMSYYKLSSDFNKFIIVYKLLKYSFSCIEKSDSIEITPEDNKNIIKYVKSFQKKPIKQGTLFLISLLEKLNNQKEYR